LFAWALDPALKRRAIFNGKQGQRRRGQLPGARAGTGLSGRGAPLKIARPFMAGSSFGGINQVLSGTKEFLGEPHAPCGKKTIMCSYVEEVLRLGRSYGFDTFVVAC
jgi:hypothetical protein